MQKKKSLKEEYGETGTRTGGCIKAPFIETIVTLSEKQVINSVSKILKRKSNTFPFDKESLNSPKMSDKMYHALELFDKEVGTIPLYAPPAIFIRAIQKVLKTNLLLEREWFSYFLDVDRIHKATKQLKTTYNQLKKDYYKLLEKYDEFVAYWCVGEETAEEVEKIKRRKDTFIKVGFHPAAAGFASLSEEPIRAVRVLEALMEKTGWKELPGGEGGIKLQEFLLNYKE